MAIIEPRKGAIIAALNENGANNCNVEIRLPEAKNSRQKEETAQKAIDAISEIVGRENLIVE